MMDDENKWIAVDKRSSRLWIRFRVKGHPKQYQIATGLKDTKKNRELVRIKRDIIANDIALGQFDPSLERYQFKAGKHLPPSSPPSKNEPTLGELWTMFTEYQSGQVEQTTIYSVYKTVGSTINRLPTQSLKDAPKIKNWLVEKVSPLMARKYFRYFEQCCRWAVEEGVLTINPFESIKIKFKKTQPKDDCKAFTTEQRDLIIKSFEEHPRYGYYASLVKFLFWTGCRHGEAFALKWTDVSEDCLKINFSKSRNLLHLEKGTKNGKTRAFSCTKGSKLNTLLLTMKLDRKSKNSPIFLSKRGSRMSSSILTRVWNKDCDRNVGVVRGLAEKGLVPYRSPYSTRHTFASGAIASGATPDKVAYWVGDSVSTVLRYYVHPAASKIDCPDF
jgi:integrase